MRWISLREKLYRLRKQFTHVSSQRFFYNLKSDLRQYYNGIVCWFLIHDLQKGYSLHTMLFRRKENFSVSEWALLIAKGNRKYISLFRIYTENVLPAINVKTGSRWRFKSLVGWSGLRGISKRKDTHIFKQRKTIKKRHARKRHKRRR